MKIAVMAYVDFNLGDDLFLDILFRKYSNHEFHLLSPYENIEQKKPFSEYGNVVGIKTKELMKSVNKFDGLVIIGGSIFQDYKYIYKSYLRRNILISLFRAMNKKVFILGCNIGPILSKTGENIFKYTFKMANFITVRDEKSYKILEGMKSNKNFAKYPDIVFGLDREYNKTSRNEENFNLGISVINHYNSSEDVKLNYVNSLSDLINKYLDKNENNTVSIFGFDSGVENDEYIINMIIDKVSFKERVKSVMYIGDIDDFMNKFISCNFMVCTRFHSLVLSLKYDINFLPIIYSEKTTNLLNDLNYRGISVDYKNIKNANTDEMLSYIYNNDKNVDINEEYFDLAKQHFNQLSNFLNK